MSPWFQEQSLNNRHLAAFSRAKQPVQLDKPNTPVKIFYMKPQFMDIHTGNRHPAGCDSGFETATNGSFLSHSPNDSEVAYGLV